MSFLYGIAEFFLHLDAHINEIAAVMGPWLYILLFFVIFAETGFVVTPFLPGDSLIFAVGALASHPDSPISVFIMFATLIIAAVLGNTANYFIGRWLGPKIFVKTNSRWLNREHLTKAQVFYQKHGALAIVLARFLPIIRTFAPFVAGIGKMDYKKFTLFNILGAAGWVSVFLFAGYEFGALPAVKNNFHYIILGIIAVSVLPFLAGLFRGNKTK